MESSKFLKEIETANLFDQVTLASLKREVELSGRPVEAVIVERRLIDDSKLAQLKAQALKVPYKKVKVEDITKELYELFPEETVRTYGVIPIEKQNDLLVVGMVNPDDLKAQEAIKFIARRTHLNLGVYLISWSDWQAVLQKYSPYKSEIESAIKSLNLKSVAERDVISLEAGKGGAEDGPVIRIVAETFREAVARGASDIHIEPQQNYLRIRLRVDGELREEAALPPELGQPVISRIKVISNLKIDETRIPQDGRFRTTVSNRSIDFRVSTFPTPHGEKVAIRVLDPTTGLKSFDELGLMGKNAEYVKEGLAKPFGMVLVTGPTGSGKSTSLYALLQALNKESANIVSLEDPVEYFVTGVNQSQVHPEIGYDFASGLRQILRQDPDVIMVGEIRDTETAGLAVHAALTGHVVLSTLHTNNSVSVIPRLLDMKIDSFLLPASLNLMVAQRLALRLCENCKQAEEGSKELQTIIKKAVAGLSPDLVASYKEPYTVYHAPGCNVCRGKGTIGRMAIFEVFRMMPELEAVISGSFTMQTLIAEAKRQGMVTMRQDGVLKALAGLVSLEDVLRETTEF
ncbi:MAG: GspE/PulE family protein [Patescibacteria group bacterium]